MPENASPRNIVICFDGTGNKFGETNSNVVKIYIAACIDKDQLGYYHPGVGTMGAPTATNRWSRMWSIIKGVAFGAGFRDNVLDAYRYLMSTYRDGDCIFVFGFSRGSYTARAMLAMLHAYGLLCPGNEGHIPYVWSMFLKDLKYAHGKSNSLPVADAFKQTFSREQFSVHFVGLWDTVSSVGWITEPLRLLYMAQNPIIKTGRHAISIDERRCFYVDNIWGDALPGQDILQVWFAGVHSDIGGSYAQSESYLSNIGLDWILSEAEAAGLLVQHDRVKMLFGQPTEGHYAAAGYFGPPNPMFPIHKSLKGKWWLLEVLPHRHYDKDDAQEKWRIPWGASRQVPAQSVVHPTAVERMKDRAYSYSPRNLALADLSPHPGRQDGTANDLTGFYVYKADKAKPATLPAQTASAGNVAGPGTAAAAMLLAGLSLLKKLL